MPSFEEEALRRAQQMHRANPQQNSREEKTSVSEKKPEEKEKHIHKTEKELSEKSTSVMDCLMSDKEQSLILLLILLLSGENADPSLLLALMYLLM